MANAPIIMPLPAEGDEISRAQALAKRYHSEFVDLKNFRIQHELFKSVPVDMMFRYNFVPLEQSEGRLVIAVSDPSKLMVLDEISGLLASGSSLASPRSRRSPTCSRRPSSRQRVLDEASEGLTFDVLSSEDNPDETSPLRASPRKTTSLPSFASWTRPSSPRSNAARQIFI